jgi:hypothetical protein
VKRGKGVKEPRKPWLIPVIVGVVALIVGIAIGASTKSSSSKNAAGAATTTATVTVGVTTSPTAAAPAVVTTPATTAPAVAKTVLQISGNGAKTTADFAVTQAQWTIAYTYNCANAGGEGNFIVEVYDHTNQLDVNKPGINELGASGNSSTVEHGNGTYYLSVNSEYNWTLTVTG